MGRPEGCRRGRRAVGGGRFLDDLSPGASVTPSCAAPKAVQQRARPAPNAVVIPTGQIFRTSRSRPGACRNRQARFGGQVGHLRMARKVLASSAFIGMVAIGLPLAPTSALTEPVAASPRAISQLAAAPPSGCAAQAPGPGDHCLPLSAEITGTVVTTTDRCTALVVLQVQLVKSVVQYNASWVPAGQTAATFYSAAALPGGYPGIVSSTGTFSTGEIAYGDLTYKVPKGAGAWCVGQGSVPGACTSPGPGTVQAWGWTARPVVRGHVTFEGSGGPAAGIRVKASCASGGTTTTR